MTTAVLSIGANVGDGAAHLRTAAAAFADELVAVSPVYQTPPWGGVEQEDYLNAVLLVTGDLDAAGWLGRAQAAERAAGRTRDVRWGPRTLDVDVIDVRTAAGVATISDDPELTVPHPRAGERAFVLLPWLDLEPGALLGGVPVAQLVAGLDVSGIRRRDDVALRP